MIMKLLVIMKCNFCVQGDNQTSNASVEWNDDDNENNSHVRLVSLSHAQPHVDTNKVSLAAIARATGYVGIGFSKSGFMVGTKGGPTRSSRRSPQST